MRRSPGKHGMAITLQHRARGSVDAGPHEGCVSYVCDSPAGLHWRRGTHPGWSHRLHRVAPETLYRSIHEQIFSLPDDTLLYPHTTTGRTVSSVAEERRLNPRLGQGKSLEEFSRIMSELQLPYPRRMDLAVPSNFNCGVARVEPGAPMPLDRSWAPVTLSPVGVPEVLSAWLQQHLARWSCSTCESPTSPRESSIAAPSFLRFRRSRPEPRRFRAIVPSSPLSFRGALGRPRQPSRSGFSRPSFRRLWLDAHGLPVEYGAEPSHQPGRQG